MKRFASKVVAAGGLFPLALVAFALAAPGAATAQEAAWPSRPIKLVVPFAAGGPADIQARWIGQQLAAALGQSVVVDTRAGAGGMIGAQTVATSPADGYTLLYASVGAIAIAPYISTRVPYDPRSDLRPVVRVATAPSVLVTAGDGRFKTVADLVGFAKANKDDVTYASAGPGTSLHLGGESLNLAAGIAMRHVPYKGAAPALLDIMAGRVDVIFADAPVVLPQLKAGKLRALAIGSPQRAAALPDVPTTAEAGYRDAQVYTWYGVLVPGKTPDALVEQINATMNRILATDAAKTFFAQQSMSIDGGSAKAFGDFIAGEVGRWTGVAKAANISLD